eukprot:17556_1
MSFGAFQSMITFCYALSVNTIAVLVRPIPRRHLIYLPQHTMYSAESFMRQHHQTILSFPLRSDFDIRNVMNGTTFQSIKPEQIWPYEIDLAKNAAVPSRIHIVENKINSRVWIQQHNNATAEDGHPIVFQFMPRILSLTLTEYNSWLFQALILHCKWSCCGIHPIFKVRQAARRIWDKYPEATFLMKPSHLSQSHGIHHNIQLQHNRPIIALLESQFTAFQEANYSVDNLRISVPRQEPGIIIEQTYPSWNGEPIELRMWMVWGVMHHASFWINGTAVALTRDRKFVHKVLHYKAIKGFLNEYLNEHVWDQLVRNGEYAARTFGCYGLRMDTFFGDKEFGTRFNEFAYPNLMNYVDDDVIWLANQRLEIIKQGFMLLSGETSKGYGACDDDGKC